MAPHNFEKRNNKFIKKMNADNKLKNLTKSWFEVSSKYEYSYHFRWLGRPIIQFPQDIIALQEIVWKIKPDLIIETGIARGGSLIFFASLLELIGKGKVVGIDIDIRKQNKKVIEKHPLFKRIKMIKGSSTDNKIITKIKKISKNSKKVMVVLDSNHTHEHVLNELQLYSPLVTKNSYLVVLDTIIEDMNHKFSKNKPWGKGNNPKTALKEFLKTSNRFVIDNIENKLLITVAPSGYLKCIKD